ncbi:hypothetical protein TNCV_3421901 [Trichonephila clavipes]|nr:hypothetical protein TNCV_3421901 [Trichonephila clavipes]
MQKLSLSLVLNKSRRRERGFSVSNGWERTEAIPKREKGEDSKRDVIFFHRDSCQNIFIRKLKKSARDLLQLQKFFTCSYCEDKETIQPGFCLLNPPMYRISIQRFHTEASSPYFAVRDAVDFDVPLLLRNSITFLHSAA